MQNIEVGTRVYSSLYGGRFGTIYKIEGDQAPQTVAVVAGVLHTGGKAYFGVVFDNGNLTERLPEAILRGVQWRVLDEVETGEQIADRLAYSQAERERKLAEQQAASEAFAAAIEALKNDPAYSHLEQSGGYAKQAAANIRKELKKAFPKVKFGVRTRGHDCVNVDWTDGPTAKEVEAIVSKYKGGHFDGMTDCYVSTKSPWTTVFGSADYVFTSRGYTAEMAQRAIDDLFATRHSLKDIAKPSGEAWGAYVHVSGEQWDLATLIRQRLNEMEA